MKTNFHNQQLSQWAKMNGITINHGESREITTEGEKEWMEYWDREKRLKDKINAQ